MPAGPACRAVCSIMGVTIGLSETGRGTPGSAMVATADRSGQARTISSRRAHAGRQAAATWPLVAPGHGHGQVDVVVLAEEDPLEPVLLDPGQVPDEAEQAGPGRHTGSALLLGGQPRGHPDHRVALHTQPPHRVLASSCTGRPAVLPPGPQHAAPPKPAARGLPGVNRFAGHDQGRARCGGAGLGVPDGVALR
jgi:hypothetical protein